MAQSYTVQHGDTLGAIAQKYGVNPTAITGYKSGNPNLIMPGEVLTIQGGAQPAGIPAAAPAASPAPAAPAPTNSSSDLYNALVGAQTGSLDSNIAGLNDQIKNNDTSFNTTSGTLNDSLAASIADINKNQADQKSQMLADQSNLGLVGSGNTDAGLSSLAYNTGTSLNNLELQKASSLAQAALSHDSTNDTLSGQIANLQGQKANIESGAADDVATRNQTNSNDLVSLMSNPYLISQLSDNYPDLLKAILEGYGHTVTD